MPMMYGGGSGHGHVLIFMTAFSIMCPLLSNAMPTPGDRRERHHANNHTTQEIHSHPSYRLAYWYRDINQPGIRLDAASAITYEIDCEAVYFS
jgi:hypothetical protein